MQKLRPLNDAPTDKMEVHYQVVRTKPAYLLMKDSLTKEEAEKELARYVRHLYDDAEDYEIRIRYKRLDKE